MLGKDNYLVMAYIGRFGHSDDFRREELIG